MKPMVSPIWLGPPHTISKQKSPLEVEIQKSKIIRYGKKGAGKSKFKLAYNDSYI